jgi:superfamily I DNA/RNA helicase
MPTFNKTPKCPQCSAKMVMRTGKRGDFWGCSRFAQGCRGTREVITLPPFNPADMPPGSTEQKSIWDFLATGDENGLVEARAGSGKTYTITNGIYQLRDQKIAVFSFNTHIIKELNSQLKAKNITWVRGLTYNSFGFKSVKTAFPKTELFKDKLEGVLIELLPDMDSESFIVRNAAERLTRLCKCYMEDGKDQDVLAELIDRFNVDLGNDCTPQEMERRVLRTMELVPRALRLCLDRKSIIDFDDQVWFTVMLGLPVERFDMVLVDEAQDTNMMQQRLIEMVCPVAA